MLASSAQKLVLRAPPAVSLMRRDDRDSPFFIWTARNDLVVFLDLRFHLDLGFHLSGEPMLSPLPGARLGVWRKQKRGKHRVKFPPRLVARLVSSSERGKILPPISLRRDA
jgi:hypothetical protein